MALFSNSSTFMASVVCQGFYPGLCQPVKVFWVNLSRFSWFCHKFPQTVITAHSNLSQLFLLTQSCLVYVELEVDLQQTEYITAKLVHRICNKRGPKASYNEYYSTLKIVCSVQMQS